MSLVGELEYLFEQVRPRLDAVFVRWQRLEPSLEEFASVDELIAFCRTQDRALYAEKNEALAALCRMATPTAYPGSSDAEAGVLVVYLFSGAFRNVTKQIGPCLLSLDELDSEMLCGFWEAAARVRTNSRAASTRLYHGARIRAWQAVAQARQRACSTADLDCATVPPPVPSPNPPAILSRALQEGVIDQIQCELIAATQIDKERPPRWREASGSRGQPPPCSAPERCAASRLGWPPLRKSLRRLPASPTSLSRRR